MSKKEKERFESSEMFVAKADKNRCLFGCIKRLKDDNGKLYVFSRIVVNDELLCASTPEQRELGDNLIRCA
jgi:hypothetical protein